MIKWPNDKQWRLARKTMIFMHTYHYNKIWANISYLPVQNYWQYILQSTFLRKNRTHFDTPTMDTRNDYCLYITLSNHNKKVLINSDMHFCTSECSFICRSIKFWQYTVLQVHSFDSASELQRTDQNSHWFSDLIRLTGNSYSRKI